MKREMPGEQRTGEERRVKRTHQGLNHLTGKGHGRQNYNRIKMKGDRIYKAAMKEAFKENSNLQYVYQLLIKAQHKKHIKAIYALGTWYLFGKFVEKNLGIAFELLSEAADGNHPEACFDLAKCYEEGVGTTKSLKDAFQHYLRAALLGDKQAIYEVGRCYYYGIGIHRNKKLADIWLNIASYNGIES